MGNHGRAEGRMNDNERGVTARSQGQHAAQLFDTGESLAESVSAYLMRGYETGANLLIVARPKHWKAIELALRSRGCDVAKGLQENRIVVLDASATLRAISRDQCPARERFDELVGRLTRRLGGTGLVAFGEMVDLLAEEGNFSAALTLEMLWDALVQQTSVSVMCGYSSAHFVSAPGDAQLERVSRLHSDVCVSLEDPLGTWLLQKARLAFKVGLAQTGS
jgi:hypothetical protein